MSAALIISRWLPSRVPASSFPKVAAVLALMTGAVAQPAVAGGRTYTTDADFDEGILDGVQHDTVHDQLQLVGGVPFPFLWVPNEQDTVSWIDTETGDELGRYRTGPAGFDGQPSRTTVDFDGSCWVANRYAGTIIKIGRYEAGQWIDRNGDGICQTSEDLNGDGDITGSEMLPWGEDECVLYEVVLIPGSEGTYTPGEFPGPYPHDWTNPGPRSVAVDINNNLWVGCLGSQRFYYVDGETGQILETVDVSPWNHKAYGATIDRNGILWSSGHNRNHVLRLDPSTTPPSITTVGLGHFSYGVGPDYLGHLFVSGWQDRRLSRINTETGVKEWTQYKSELYQARGVACTPDNDVWVASTANDRVYRYDNDGNYKTEIYVGDGPTGVAVDAAGKVWVCNVNDEYVKRIDPVTNTIDLAKQVVGSGGHYSYSDMTGLVLTTITATLGTWTVVYDSDAESMSWGRVSWTSYESEGAVITVQVKSSEDQANWSEWEAAANNVPLLVTPDGRYLEIETTFEIVTGTISPTLYDLTVEDANPPGVPSDPNPADGAVDVPLDAVLSWAPVVDAEVYDVYLWRAADPKPDTPVSADQQETSYQPPDGLEDDTQYMWQVVVKNYAATTPGPEWTFTTIARPNLVVSNADAPGEAWVGQQIDVSWTVTNEGAAPATGMWEDCVYLSDDDQIGGDTPLGCADRPNELYEGESYDGLLTVTIPGVEEGDYCIIIRVDDGDAVPEANEADNDAIICPITIRRPNLTTSDLEIPAEATVGQEVDVGWRVTNTGSVPAIGIWWDCVYLSDDEEIGGDIPLPPCLERPADLDAGRHYDRVATVMVPAVPEGEYWIVVCADDADSVPETDEMDNFMIAGPIWVYVPPCADLVPSDVEAPDRAAAGSTMLVGWTVTNLGDGATDIPFWYDRIYLSRDQEFDEDIDTRLYPDIQNPSYLNAGEWYVQDGEEVGVPDNAFGEYYVIVKADASNDLAECDEDNNVAVSVSIVEIIPEPLPDLIVLDVGVAPDSPWSGEQITVTWTAKNDGLGDIPAAAHWSNAIYLSGEFDGQPVWRWLGVVWKDGPLAAGETYVASKQVTLPARYYGPFQICIALDGHEGVDESNESNNVGCSDEFTIQMPPPADLEFTDPVVVPLEGWSGQWVDITWTVRNGSTDTTWVDAWNDRVILSRDADPDTLEDNTDLATYRHYGALAFDEQYTAEKTVQLPVDADGDYYLCIVTDADDEVYEWDEDNNAICEPINIEFAPPNLEVTACATQPLSLSVGGELTVDWTVENTGPGDTPNDSWTDRLYLSVDMVIDGSDVVLADVTHEGVLISGDGYDATATIALPLDVSGDTFYVIVKTDSGEEVYETSEADNTCVSNSFEILAPDLRPEECTTLVDGVPVSTVPPGGAVTVEWTVANDGPGDALAESWTDIIYLSDDDSLDEFDVELGRRAHIGPLANGDSYAESRVVAIPDDASGDQLYILVQVNGEGEVHEGPDGDANNVCATDPFAVDLPNLRTTDCLVLADGQPPTSVPSGSDVDVSWTVVNDGPGDALVIPWRDGIYLSDDDVWDVGDRLIGYVTHGTALPVGETCEAATTVTIPIDATGPALRVIVVTNDQGDVLETDETDNACVTEPFEVVWGPPDLAVISVAASQGDPSGEVVNVSWTVENLGGPTAASQWTDHVYLSADRWLDVDDELIASAAHDGALDYADSYSVDESFPVPPGLSGSFYVIVQTDATDDVAESDETNNTAYDDVPVVVGYECDSDLVVAVVDAPDTALSGQLMYVSWTVENQGNQPTNVAAWRDAVYLSRDQYLDPNSDQYLGHLSRQGVLQPGEGYTAETDMQIPGGATGRYYVFVAVDINDAVCETDETNNVGYDPESVDVILPPPADLVATDIVVPGSGTLGEDVTIGWTVENQGEFQAQGNWHDSVYISADAVWDIGDKKIGKVRPAGPLDPNDSYTESLTAPLPGVVPGDYYIIVRADIHNEVRESPDGEMNNTTVSLDQTSAHCTELTLGVPYPGTMSTGDARYFQVYVSSGETLRLTLDALDDTGVIELFVRYGELPDRVHYDEAYSDPFAADQEIVLGPTEEGMYYILAYAASGVPEDSAYTLLAEVLPFEIREVTPTVVGDTGHVTLRIFGSQFDPGDEVDLVDSNETVVRASRRQVLDSSEILAAFTLMNLAHGPATVRVTKQDATFATLDDAVEVTYPVPATIETALQGPSVIRFGTSAEMVLTYQNIGNIDADEVILVLTSDGSAVLEALAPAAWPVGASDPQFDTMAGAMVWSLPPHETGALPIRVTPIRTGMLDISIATVVRERCWSDPGRPAYGPIGTGSLDPWNPGDPPPPGGSVLFNYSPGPPWTGHTALKLPDCNVAHNIPIPEGSQVITWEDYVYLYVKVQDGGWIGYHDPHLTDGEKDLLTDWVRLNTPDDGGTQYPYTPWTKCTDFVNAAYIAVGHPLFLAHDWRNSPALNYWLLEQELIPAIGPHAWSLWKAMLDPIGLEFDLIYSLLRQIRSVWSFDPNEKVAPAGYGERLFVRPAEDLPYTIRFENLPDATAPAQVVTITDQLDPNLDWRAFRLGTIAFGDTVVEVPENRAYYTTDIDLTDSLGVIVRIDGGIDIMNGSAEWTLTAIDPETGEIPTDPLLGFLPPNDPNTHCGEGYVTFLIRASSDVSTGTEVTNTATITFGINEPIETNEVFNTVDSGKPGSEVDALPPEWPTPDIDLQWSGADDDGGSGIGWYSIYYRLDAGPYMLWTTTPETLGTFTGALGGGQYDFYSIATDNVGNAEDAPDVPDASTTVAVQVPPAPMLDGATAATVQILNLGQANVDSVEHAVYEETTDQYVGEEGRLGLTPAWLPLDEWTDFQVRALNASTTYSFAALARSASGSETPLGEASPITTSRAGDVNGDGAVTYADLGLVRRALGTRYDELEFDARADLNGDDRVTYVDLGIVRRNLGRERTPEALEDAALPRP